MLAFIPLLVAYATFWSSVLIFRVPIPTPSPALLTLSSTPSPLLSLVSVVEEINTVINSLPAVLDLVHSATSDTRSVWYLDASPISPIPPPLNLLTCVPLDWPPLSDFCHLGTGTCDRVTSTDLAVWDGLFEPIDPPSKLASAVDDDPTEDVWYFATLVASGLGFWLMCRLIAAVILKWSNSTSTKGHLAENEPFETVSCQQFGSANSLTEPKETISKSPMEGTEESDERTPSGPAKGFTGSASFVPAAGLLQTCPHRFVDVHPCTTPLPSPLSPSHSFNWVIHESPVSPPSLTDVHRYHPIPLWSPKPSDIVSFYDVTAEMENRN
ncbi:hypothetical protein BDM02DRAFT_3123337, partial [Thelephora ganbajun]